MLGFIDVNQNLSFILFERVLLLLMVRLDLDTFVHVEQALLFNHLILWFAYLAHFCGLF